MIVVVGLSHKTAPIEVRERLAVGRDALPTLLQRLVAHPAIGEAVVLSTCNRVEIYAAPCGPGGAGGAGSMTSERPPASLPPEVTQTREMEALHAVVGALCGLGGDGIRPYLAGARGLDAVLHLFRVAASLDSLVVGEPQILGQLKEALVSAREAGSVGPRLAQAMHRAFKVGKRARAETAIGAGQVSVSSVAIELARQIFADLAGRSALLVGAGEMAEAASRLLVRAGARLTVVNRSPERAAALAREVGGEPRAWSELERSVIEADIVVSSTSSPTYVIPVDLVRRARKARRGRSLFLIDIAVPRDVDPAVNDLDNVYLYDVDDLSQIVAQSLEERAVEAARAEEIVRDEVRGYEAWALERALTPTIVDLRARTRSILAAEVERSLSGKLRHLSTADRQALAMMVEAATNKLLHVPTTRLRAMAGDERAEDHVEALRELFDLDSSPQGELLPLSFDGASNGASRSGDTPLPGSIGRSVPPPSGRGRSVPPPSGDGRATPQRADGQSAPPQSGRSARGVSSSAVAAPPAIPPPPAVPSVSVVMPPGAARAMGIKGV
ncbi:glutamyl-tRNA reductase [Chondromyces crocatus]|uniref:Glutamyl-tRNA reductase n=1 Tax=Chondromyces crocatus TaxID=52 RepID=A0A0K1ENX2_CHOCO|nr:glutamyl-tRNA reductase [Chondromyces crocatus]AKT42352.1 glutamyl-tRNA reductase [Chondromyces crocatus]